MRLFGRRGRSSEASDAGETDLGVLLLQGEDMVNQLAEAHASWGLGTAERWDLDQRTGMITWTFADKTATAAAQILASYNPSTASWLWAWANESILAAMSRDSRAVRDWAERHGQQALVQPRVQADAELAATLSALAVRITRATGFYRGAGSAAIPIIIFGPVTLTSKDGETSTFTINVS
ncbi:hypothetical protein GCM10010168_79310 [Actinoplanes ianthinogenes]|uniref:Uncharacterized protein n=1 Tax=Actinoplanes ianthinogenes TaxID=122358 RepID=A0ABM7LK44_9ACTN|nr:DUF6882 domain-containing protein [Actinoplanes ianthinogenes]BCJ39614.1 hypothetical protein Aiant_02710 [Actinoplanes ianthinogenes]GGR48543.1 hypothetical protein GCM10010168_79310 [Actinoplanes ianthinogenes]